MTKEKKSILKPIYIIIFWTIIALLYGGQSYISYALKGEACNFWGTVLEHVPTFLIWAIFAPIIIRILDKYPIISSKNTMIDLLFHVGAATVLGMISLVVIGTGRWLYFGLGEISLIEYTKAFSLVWFIYQYIMYTAMLLFLLTINYYQKFRDKEARNIELQKMLLESQLSSLKMQLHPHFLFNTLNTISMLVRMDKKESANKVISRLGDMLRQVLLSKDDQMVTIEKEMQLIDKYLSIESIRFEESLTYEFKLAESTLNYQVPDMLLQPIVENSIKHGMKNLNGVMHVEIASGIDKGRLKIEVKDNGKGFNTYDKGFLNRGIGLKNTLERCEKIFGKNQVEIKSEQGKGTTTIFTFPIIDNNNE
ncbi:MAG: hypothetical protein C0597_13915 [Marinilabiliales bacterium]|nr:MAG: hypothetical protein C0597_13915 [Marinilabiliales bacterium]